MCTLEIRLHTLYPAQMHWIQVLVQSTALLNQMRRDDISTSLLPWEVQIHSLAHRSKMFSWQCKTIRDNILLGSDGSDACINDAGAFFLIIGRSFDPFNSLQCQCQALHCHMPTITNGLMLMNTFHGTSIWQDDA